LQGPQFQTPPFQGLHLPVSLEPLTVGHARAEPVGASSRCLTTRHQ
jgi:hypothetical protein